MDNGQLFEHRRNALRRYRGTDIFYSTIHSYALVV